ncbi:unnamed protein product [Agarophyton chilense]
MAHPINDPTFPVIDSDPSFGKVMSSLRARDWQNAALATFVSLPFGYAAGRPVVMRPSMYMAGVIGASFGLFLGFQNSFTRLTGYKENAVEIAKYGSKGTVSKSSA